MRGKQFLNGAADRATMVDGCPVASQRVIGKREALSMGYGPQACGKTTTAQAAVFVGAHSSGKTISLHEQMLTSQSAYLAQRGY